MVEAITKQINIRRMIQTDIDSVVELNRQFEGGKSTITYKDIATTFTGGPLDLSFVAEINNKVIGFILARLTYVYIPFTEVCLINSIVIAREYQHQNIGSKLVNELINRCKLEGICTVRALVNEQDTVLKNFIEHLGFRRSIIINYDMTVKI